MIVLVYIFVSLCDYRAKCYINRKTIQCLPNLSQYTLIYLQQFPSYSNRKCKKSPFFRVPQPTFFLSNYFDLLFPLETSPATITQYVAWMERQLNACQTSCSMYPSIFNSFRVIRTASVKNNRFGVPQPTFCFPLETPLRLPPYIGHVSYLNLYLRYLCF